MMSRGRLSAPMDIQWATRREFHNGSQRTFKKFDELQFSSSNYSRVTDLTVLRAVSGPRDVDSTTKVKESSQRSMNYNFRIRIAVT